MATDIAVEKIDAWRGYSVEWHDGLSVVLSRRNCLYSAHGIGGSPTLIGKVPLSFLTRVSTFTRAGQRFRRAMFYNVLPLGDGRWFATFANRMGVLSPDGWSEIHLPRPSRILRGGVAVAPDGAFWFGEYWHNPNRGSMRIYRWQAGQTRAQVAHEFNRGAVYHIHSISWDPYRSAFICLTGDRGRECQILISRDGFRTIDTIGSGSEEWRAVSIVPVPSGWIFGTDAEYQTNVIAHVDADSSARRVLGQVAGPVYYGRSWGTDALFGVTAERCEIMPNPEAVLLRVVGDEVQPLARFGKDIGDSTLVWKLFMPGTLHFALGRGEPRHFFVSGVGLRDFDEQVLVLRRL